MTAAELRAESQILSAVPAGRREQRLAAAVVLVSVAVFAALAPLAKVPLGNVPAFIPLYQAALVIVDVTTAMLLFAQWRVAPMRPLFVLACGYVFTACMTVAHTVTFPGLFSPQGLLGAGTQSTAWIYMFWHALFPVFVAGYASASPLRMSRAAAVAGVAATVALAGALVALATAGESLLPAIMAGHGYRATYHLVVAAVWLCSAGALYLLWRRPARTVLDMWMIIVMSVWICEVGLAAVFNAGRFDLGFYAGRIYGLVAASFVLCGLLYEAADLYARFAAAQGERAARAEAEAANRAKDQFLAILGHELRNPLAPIVTALQLMRMRDPNALAAERLILERQVAHLTRLVDDLLDISRLTQGKVELRCESCEIADIVARAVEMSAPLIESRRHRLEIDVPPAGLAVHADGQRLAQVIANLLSNAAKFTPTGGRIRVQAAKEDGSVVLRVRDDGAGLSPELRGRLFEPFAQGPQSFERSEGGLGLGLAIVRNLVALHGGSVEAHSDGAGRGSEFVLRLPAKDAAGAEGPGPRPRQSAEALEGHAGPRVLVVDDNPDGAAALAQSLRLSGMEVRTALDGPQALEVAAQFRPQVAFVDLGLPAMDGFELAERLRKLPGLSGLRLAAVTGYGESPDRARSAAAGFAAHFVKPALLEELVAFALETTRAPHVPEASRKPSTS